MNKKNYTVDEILSAINELNEKKVKVDIGIKKRVIIYLILKFQKISN